jgi:mannose-6-phosphate isomerase-like protein (cupin superfamily)
MTYSLINLADMRRSATSHSFEGGDHGARVCVIIVDMRPDQAGPKLHSHPYEEIFIVQEGRATYTVGTQTLEITAGQVVVVPPHTPHKFTNTGDGPLRQVDIHVSETFITEWLEE